MKKLLFTCACMMMLGLLVVPVYAVEYRTDVLEPGNTGGWTTSLKTFDTSYSVSQGETFEVDIWLDVSDDSATAFNGGFLIDFSAYTDKIAYVSTLPYEAANGGPWQNGAGNIINDVYGPGTQAVLVGSLSGVTPDGGGDIIVAKVTFECLVSGLAEISVTSIPDGSGGFIDAWIPWDDALITGATLTLEQSCSTNEECDDGNFCNGEETCDVGGSDTCQPGTDPCTPEQFCIEPDTCADCLVDGDCADSLWCNGDETCVGGSCQAGEERCPDDTFFCTGTESCNENLQRCENTGDPCAEGEICAEPDQCVIPPCEVAIVPPSTVVFTFEEFQFATTSSGVCETPCYTWEITNQESTGSMIVGAGTNDATGAYTAGSGPGTDTITVTDACNGSITAEATVTVEEQPCTSDEECDDGVFCNGAETCDIGVTDLCQGGAPVDCDDAVACTDDSCNEGTDSCDNVPNDASCPDDGEYCTGTEICDAELGCTSTGDPCTGDTVCDEDSGECVGCLDAGDCDDSNECTTDTCEAQVCVHTPVDNGTACNDGKYCTETDSCQEGVCVGSGNPCPPGYTCSESQDRCIAPECTSNAQCDDGVFCNGAETCVSNTCQPGTAPCEAPQVCDEANDDCVECLVDADCDDGVLCNGAETCDPEAGCRPGSDPCPDDGEYCNGEESCDEAADQCVSSGDPCEEGDICKEDTDTCEPGISIDATFEGCGRAFGYGFGTVTIQGTGTNFGLLSIVEYDSREVVKIIKLVNAQTITQFVLLLPSFDPWFPVLLPAYPNTVGVTVETLTDTFEIPSCR